MLLPSFRHIDKGCRDEFWNLCRIYQLRARSHHDVFDKLQEMKMPVLCCAGENDCVATPASMLKMANKIQNGEFKLYKGGHGFIKEKNDSVADIASFISA